MQGVIDNRQRRIVSPVSKEDWGEVVLRTTYTLCCWRRQSLELPARLGGLHKVEDALCDGV